MKHSEIWLIGLRGLLCIFICLYHFTTRYAEVYNEHFYVDYKFGAPLGVTAFFIISGFLNTKSILMNGTSCKAALNWFARKYLRLWVPYIICISTTLILLSVIGLPGRDHFSLLQIVKDILMLPFISGHIEGATWYVMALVYFYLQIIIISKLNLLDKYWFHVTVILFSSVLYFCDVTVTTIYLNKFFGQLPLFMGSLLYILYRDKSKLTVVILYLAEVIIISVTSSYVSGIISVLLLILFISPNIGPIYWFERILRYILTNNNLVEIGRISYTWYLLHQKIGHMVIFHLLQASSHYKEAYPYIALVTTFVLSLFIDKLIVTPIMKKL